MQTPELKKEKKKIKYVEKLKTIDVEKPKQPQPLSQALNLSLPSRPLGFNFQSGFSRFSRSRFQISPISPISPSFTIQYKNFDFNPHFVPLSDWQQSDYGYGSERFYDQTTRKSQYMMAKLVQPYQKLSFPSLEGEWRVIKYMNGYFKLHEDKQENENHIGTQILIFPKIISPHTFGTLKIYEQDQEKYIQIGAQEFVYIYVYIDLGVKHQITRVQGIRTVATRKTIVSQPNRLNLRPQNRFMCD